MLGCGIATWQIWCRIAVSLSVGGVRSRCPCSGVWLLAVWHTNNCRWRWRCIVAVTGTTSCASFSPCTSFLHQIEHRSIFRAGTWKLASMWPELRGLIGQLCLLWTFLVQEVVSKVDAMNLHQKPTQVACISSCDCVSSALKGISTTAALRCASLRCAALR